jgi:oligopeptide/dipeptide ABC transporter ATP-binding protein
MRDALLSVEDLHVRFATEDGIVEAVDGVSFELYPGEVLAIVGESGSGKSVSVQTVMGLTRGTNAQFDGRIVYEGRDLMTMADEELRRLRGDDIAMIFQDPMTSLHPVYKVGWQIAEAIKAHRDVSDAEARARSVELLAEVGIPQPDQRVENYPHEFSGGMRQRAMIAMALANEPNVLIADEPTTALDVTIQAQIIQLIGRLRSERNAAAILITHDLGVVAEIADRVVVMYAGMVVEQGSLEQVFYDPQHPYTWGLLGSLARVDDERTKRLPSIAGAPPSLLNKPRGCPFRPRCPHEFAKCTELPDLEQRVEHEGHLDRCWLSVEDKRRKREVAGRIGLEAEVV